MKYVCIYICLSYRHFLEMLVLTQVMAGAAVVCCTLSGVLSQHMRDMTFDVTVVDEAAQACPKFFYM